MSKGGLPAVARNSRHRHTSYLTAGKIIGLVEAAAFARNIGRPLNRFTTINLERGDIVARPQEAVGRYLRLVGQWLGDRGIPNTFIWVLERAPGTGTHAHILLHCPGALAKPFSMKARHKWLVLSGIDPQKREGGRVIRTELVGPREFDPANATEPQRQAYLNQLRGVLRYMLKAIDPGEVSSLVARLPGDDRPTVAKLFAIRPEPNDPIYGLRCSQSHNIAATARKRHPAATKQSLSCGELSSHEGAGYATSQRDCQVLRGDVELQSTPSRDVSRHGGVAKWL